MDYLIGLYIVLVYCSLLKDLFIGFAQWAQPGHKAALRPWPFAPPTPALSINPQPAIALCMYIPTGITLQIYELRNCSS